MDVLHCAAVHNGPPVRNFRNTYKIQLECEQAKIINTQDETSSPVVVSFVDKMRNPSVLLQVWRKGNEISEQSEHATQNEEQERVQNLCMYELTELIQNVVR